MPALATATPPALYDLFGQHPPGLFLFAARYYGPGELDDKFTLPHHAEIALVEGCGCWLRHVDTAPSSAQVEDIVQSPDYDPAPTQVNHDALAAYLREHFVQDGFVEFYGCHAHLTHEPVKERLELPVEAIRHPHFHFRVGTLYCLKLAG